MFLNVVEINCRESKRKSKTSPSGFGSLQLFSLKPSASLFNNFLTAIKDRDSCLKMFFEIVALENFSHFTGKHLC